MTGTGAALRDTARLLDAWDAAATAPEIARGWAVLAAIGAIDPVGALDLPLGLLGERALRFHVEAFGAQLDGVVGCPACGHHLELALDLGLLLPVDAEPSGVDPRRAVELGGRTLTVRAPTARDLLDAGRARDPRGVVVARCVRDPTGEPVDVASLTREDVDAVDAVLEELTGAGLLTLRTACPDCAADVSAVLDPGALLWDRVRTAAPAVLREVAVLAAAFGWREADVLALSPARRRAYLELAG